jgi:hypothetical protein
MLDLTSAGCSDSEVSPRHVRMRAPCDRASGRVHALTRAHWCPLIPWRPVPCAKRGSGAATHLCAHPRPLSPPPPRRPHSPPQDAPMCWICLDYSGELIEPCKCPRCVCGRRAACLLAPRRLGASADAAPTPHRAHRPHSLQSRAPRLPSPLAAAVGRHTVRLLATEPARAALDPSSSPRFTPHCPSSSPLPPRPRHTPQQGALLRVLRRAPAQLEGRARARGRRRRAGRHERQL